uniref:transmembrane emp24 domain-containing protein 9-like n=1 Tax=Semicossyphus pulcher TaxID=241346 RepID=UPI0037E8E33E
MVSVRMKSFMLTVLLLSVFYSVVSSLYFHIGETEKKCFIEEIPEKTMIVGNVRTQLLDKQRNEYQPDTQDVSIFVVAKDPDGKLVLSRECGSDGKFSFASQKPGKHQICLQSNSSQRPLSAGAMLMVHLDIRAGEGTNDYAQIALKDKLTMLQLRVRQLYEQVQQIQTQHDYHQLSEQYFREVDHNTNMWIFWWPVIRSLYVVAVITIYTNSW